MSDWIDLEGRGWLRLIELEADEKKKRGCADFLEGCDVGKCHGCHLTA